jgi:hypothetical protein
LWVRCFEGLLCLAFWDKGTFIIEFVHAPGQVSLMEKDNPGERKVELKNSFEDVWEGVCGKNVELETEELRTPFVVNARMAKRRSSPNLEEVLVFLKNDGSGKPKECSRCYSENWGHYFNNLGKDGQRIGMYCMAVDAYE